MFLERVLVDKVTRWVILAHDEHAHMVFVTMLEGAPDARGVSPHDLREVFAIFVARTLERLEIIPLLLHVPIIHRIGRCPMQVLAPKQILAVIRGRVGQLTILVSLHEILTREAREFLVPR